MLCNILSATYKEIGQNKEQYANPEKIKMIETNTNTNKRQTWKQKSKNRKYSFLLRRSESKFLLWYFYWCFYFTNWRSLFPHIPEKLNLSFMNFLSTKTSECFLHDENHQNLMTDWKLFLSFKSRLDLLLSKFWHLENLNAAGPPHGTNWSLKETSVRDSINKNFQFKQKLMQKKNGIFQE